MDRKSPIHLFWHGEPTRQALDAQSRWQMLHPDRQVNLWTDDSVLLPRFRGQWDTHQHIAPNLSDLIRWSALKRYGGWYFDIDVSARIDLDAIEHLEHLDRLWITYRSELQQTPAGDIIYMPRDWPGVYWRCVMDWIIRCDSPAYTWCEGMLLKHLASRHPGSYTIGDPGRYGTRGLFLRRNYNAA